MAVATAAAKETRRGFDFVFSGNTKWCRCNTPNVQQSSLDYVVSKVKISNNEGVCAIGCRPTLLHQDHRANHFFCLTIHSIATIALQSIRYMTCLSLHPSTNNVALVSNNHFHGQNKKKEQHEQQNQNVEKNREKSQHSDKK